MLTFIVVFGTVMVLWILMVMIDRLDRRVEELELVILNSRIEWEEGND